MCLAVAMIVAGVASLNNALPHIAEDLHVSHTGQQWIIDAYAVALAALLLVGAAYVWLRGPSVAVAEDEDVLDLTDGATDRIDVALAPAAAEAG